MMQGITVLNKENPFPGLRPFNVEESHLFFGREHQVDELLRKLTLYHFLSVVGISGSGKSSLVRAGLLAKLYNGYNTSQGKEWIIAIMRPGADPLLNLAKCLHDKDVFADDGTSSQDINQTVGILKESPLGLIQVIRSKIARGKNFLLLVDQFEELFRYVEIENNPDNQENAEHFVKLLIECVRQQDAGINIVITLRADFLGECAVFEGLAEAINDGQYLIPKLNRDHYKLAITGPVNYANGKIAPRLVQQLLNDLNKNQDQLPILQHALMRSWDNWKKHIDQGVPMDLDDYSAVGGMDEALNMHADEAYNELNEKQKKYASLIFKCVTVKGSDNRGIRRPTKLKDILNITRISENEIKPVLEVFRKTGRGFIIPPEGVALLPETVIDISHESLMRNWKNLENWVDEEYESAQIYQRLSESAILYENNAAGLWRDPELSVALEWKSENNPNEAWALQYNDNFSKSMKFLDSSMVEKERQRAEKKKRRKITNIIISVFLLSAMLLTLWAMIERGTASKSASEANKQKTIAEKQEKIAEEKKREAENNFAIGELQRKKAEEQRLEAESQRQEAIRQKKLADEQAIKTMLQTRIAKREQLKAEDARKTAENEKQIAILQKRLADSSNVRAKYEQHIAEQQKLFSLSKSLALKSLSYDKNNEDIELKALLALQAYKLNLANKNDSFDSEIISALYEANRVFSDKGENVLIGHTSEVKAIATSNDGKYLASAGYDGKVLLWNIDEKNPGNQVLFEGKSEFNAVSFSSDNKWLAACSENNLFVWKIGDKISKPIILPGHTDKITAIVFTPGYVVSAGLDNTIIFNNLTDNSVKKTSVNSRIFSLAYSSQIKTIAVGCEDGSIYTINMVNQELAPTLLSKSGSQVAGVSFDNEGKVIAGAYSDGGLKVWYTNHSANPLAAKLAGHTSALSAVVFGKGHQLASAGLDGKVKLWLWSTSYPPVIFSEHDSWVMCLAISKDGKRIFSGGRDKTIRIYPIDLQIIVSNLNKKISRNFSKSEWTYFMGDNVPYEKVVESLPLNDK